MTGEAAHQMTSESTPSADGAPIERAHRCCSWSAKVEVDRSRDALLTDFGKTTLEDRYLLPGESYQDMFARVATAYRRRRRARPADLRLHVAACGSCRPRRCCRTAAPSAACRSPASSTRCRDSLDGIVGIWNENVWLASNGGGIGTYWGGVRSIGEKVKGAGQTSGIIPFIRVMDCADAGDQPGLAAPRLGGGLPRHPPPGDRGVPRDPQAVGRLQPQVA